MNTRMMKKIGITVLTGTLIACMGTSVFAAPKSAEAPVTGRTEQARATGVITANTIPALARHATSATLSGTVVIDGPQLVLFVNGVDVSANAKLTKIDDKTWMYQYTASVTGLKGDVPFSIDAHTVYVNGKTAGQIHTRAARSIIQTVHVPYIVSYDYANLDWTQYDRFSNVFTFSYNQVNVWNDGYRETVEPVRNAVVAGTESYYDQQSGIMITPPVYFRDFSFSSNTPVWTYEAPNYSVSFEINMTWSNGAARTETITRNDLIPGAANPVAVTVEGVTHATSFQAPSAPVVEPTITGVQVIAEAFVLRNKNSGADEYDGYIKIVYAMSDGSTRPYSNEWVRVATWTTKNVKDEQTKSVTIDGLYTVSLTYDSSKVVDEKVIRP